MVLQRKAAEKVEEMESSHKVTEKIKAHFSQLHSRLQTLEHDLNLQLQKDADEQNAWQAQVESSIKSTEAKIEKLKRQNL